MNYELLTVTPSGTLRDLRNSLRKKLLGDPYNVYIAAGFSPNDTHHSPNLFADSNIADKYWLEVAREHLIKKGNKKIPI